MARDPSIEESASGQIASVAALRARREFAIRHIVSALPRWRATVRSMLGGSLRRLVSVEDVLHDAILAAYRRRWLRKDLEEASADRIFTALIKGVILNLYRYHSRNKRAPRTFVPSVPASLEEISDDRRLSTRARETDPVARVIQGEDVAVPLGLVEALPDRDAALLLSVEPGSVTIWA